MSRLSSNRQLDTVISLYLGHMTFIYTVHTRYASKVRAMNNATGAVRCNNCASRSCIASRYVNRLMNIRDFRVKRAFDAPRSTEKYGRSDPR